MFSSFQIIQLFFRRTWLIWWDWEERTSVWLCWILISSIFVTRYGLFVWNHSFLIISSTSILCCRLLVAIFQSLMVLSSKPDASSFPSSEKAIDGIGFEWPSRVCCTSLVTVFQSLMILSSKPDASSLPSGEKAIDQIVFEWSSRVCCTSSVTVSQSLMVLSKELDASSLPSSEKAIDWIQLEWPSRVCCTSLVTVSQSLMVVSSKPDASSLPSSEKTIDRTELEWSSRVCSAAFQAFWTLGSLCNQLSICFLNLFLMILVADAKTIAKEYNCSGARLSISRFFRRKRFASFKKASSMKLLLDLIKSANVKNVVRTALLQEGSVIWRSYWYYQLLSQWCWESLLSRGSADSESCEPYLDRRYGSFLVQDDGLNSGKHIASLSRGISQ